MHVTTNNDFCKNSNRIRLKLLHFGYASVGNEWSGKIINSIYSRLYYVRSGSACIRIGDGTIFKLEQGKWYLLPSGCSFEYWCDDNLEHIFFHLKFCDYDGLDLLSNCKVPVSMRIAEDESEFFIKHLYNSNVADHLKMYNTVYKILIMFTEKFCIDIDRKDYSNCIMKAIRYIKRNLSMQLTITEISENIFVSKSTLTKHFQKELEISVNNYIHDMIMMEAEQLLVNTDMSILDISEKFGFSDQFYFSRKFKTKFGIPPREYRKGTII